VLTPALTPSGNAPEKAALVAAGNRPGLQGICREADGGTRTPDPIITSDVLYQLSYVGAGVDGSDRSGA
jgi:hypothetical protein